MRFYEDKLLPTLYSRSKGIMVSLEGLVNRYANRKHIETDIVVVDKIDDFFEVTDITDAHDVCVKLGNDLIEIVQIITRAGRELIPLGEYKDGQYPRIDLNGFMFNLSDYRTLSELKEGEFFTFGRHPSCNVVLPKSSPLYSLWHLLIVKKKESIMIYDASIFPTRVL